MGDFDVGLVVFLDRGEFGVERIISDAYLARSSVKARKASSWLARRSCFFLLKK